MERREKDGSSATSPVKGFRFLTSGKTADWSDELESISPVLAAMARKVKEPEGSSVELDESGYVLVDDSCYSPKVIGVLAAALERKKRRHDLDQLEVDDLLEYLRCADFYQLANRVNHQVCTALWTKMGSFPAQGTSAIQFKQIQFKQPLALDSLKLQRLLIEELVLQNVSIKGEVSFTEVEFTDSSLSLGLGGEFTATETVFKSSKLYVVCKKAVLESCTFQDSTWAGVPGDPVDLTIKNGVFSNTQLPQAKDISLDSVSVTKCEIPACSQLKLTNVNLSSMALTCSKLDVTDGTLTSMSLHCCPWPFAEPPEHPEDEHLATLTEVEAVHLDLRACDIRLKGLARLFECRLQQKQQPPWDSWANTGSIVASGCLFSNMTFRVDIEPLSFKDCTFHKCVFQCTFDSSGRALVLDNCTLLQCYVQLKVRYYDQASQSTKEDWDYGVVDAASVSARLLRNFHAPCQVVANTSELPEGLPGHRERSLLKHPGQAGTEGPTNSKPWGR